MMWTRLSAQCLAIIALLAMLSSSLPGEEGNDPEAQARLADLDRRYVALSALVTEERYGPGGPEVLRVAHQALRAKHAKREGLLVGLEDLWAHACQEGQVLFRQPERLWGETKATETSDMIGQDTVGPWQMTVRNIRDIYGPPYGVCATWDDNMVMLFCREHPEHQASMIIDYIQRSYEAFGRRGPYSIQRYFWLEPFVRGELGQGNWMDSPVAKAPGGDWSRLTPEMKRQTGLYAKQVLLGARYTQRGLLHYLVLTGDTEGAREVLRTWRYQQRLVLDGPTDGELGGYRLTDENGGFAIKPDDIVFPEAEPALRQTLQALVSEVSAESEQELEIPLPTIEPKPNGDRPQR